MPAPIGSEQILAAHQLYCQLTGQSLGLGFDRERQWYEWLRAGFTLQDLRRVVRESRRNVGALKLSNLLQLDRFEEDLNIRRVRLEPVPPPPASTPVQLRLSEVECELGRLRALERLRQIKDQLRD
jgi:hypothetical protein